MSELERGVFALILCLCFGWFAYVFWQVHVMHGEIHRLEQSIQETDDAFLNGCTPAGGM